MGTTTRRQKEAKKELDSKLSLSRPDRSLLEELAVACAKKPSPQATFQYAFALSKSSEPSELRYAVSILDGLVSEGFEHQVDCMYGAATALYLLGDYTEARSRCEAILRTQPSSRIAKELHLASIESEEQQQQREFQKAAVGGVAAAAAIGVAAGLASLLLSKKGFHHSYGSTSSKTTTLWASSSDPEREAQELIEQARKLRQEIPERPIESLISPWRIDSATQGLDYRLYVDIGREEGTWMDPRWGASGKRIEFTLDVRFCEIDATSDVRGAMVKDNVGGKSSPIWHVMSAPNARLRQGFDSLKCAGGAYRIDTSRNSKTWTLRFFVNVEGKDGPEYGDISVPMGRLFFSLPSFNGGISQLSRKEGPVTIRQMGWKTGWRREESRIVGTFRAIPLAEASQRDGY